MVAELILGLLSLLYCFCTEAVATKLAWDSDFQRALGLRLFGY